MPNLSLSYCSAQLEIFLYMGYYTFMLCVIGMICLSTCPYNYLIIRTISNTKGLCLQYESITTISQGDLFSRAAERLATPNARQIFLESLRIYPWNW